MYKYDEEFKQLVIEEYLDERSHYRQTGIKTVRYDGKDFVKRDLNKDPIEENGRYIPLKPKGWDEAYKDAGVPKWASERYQK